MNNRDTRTEYFNHITSDEEYSYSNIKQEMDYLYDNFDESSFLKMLDFIKTFINFPPLERKIILDIISSLEHKFNSNDFYKFVNKYKLNEIYN
jgi:hypothetical protein